MMLIVSMTVVMTVAVGAAARAMSMFLNMHSAAGMRMITRGEVQDMKYGVERHKKRGGKQDTPANYESKP